MAASCVATPATLCRAPLTNHASRARFSAPKCFTRQQGMSLPSRQVVARRQRASVVVAAAAASAEAAASTPHLQLATAKLPADVNTGVFSQQLYQWASTLTTNGRNLPFALPQRVDKLANGFQMSLLRVDTDGSVRSVADLVASVEPVSGTGDVLMVRLYEGEAAATALKLGAPPAGASAAAQQERLQTLLSGLVDIPVIMTTMPAAIKRAVMLSR